MNTTTTTTTANIQPSTISLTSRAPIFLLNSQVSRRMNLNIITNIILMMGLQEASLFGSLTSKGIKKIYDDLVKEVNEDYRTNLIDNYQYNREASELFGTENEAKQFLEKNLSKNPEWRKFINDCNLIATCKIDRQIVDKISLGSRTNIVYTCGRILVYIFCTIHENNEKTIFSYAYIDYESKRMEYRELFTYYRIKYPKACVIDKARLQQLQVLLGVSKMDSVAFLNNMHGSITGIVSNFSKENITDYSTLSALPNPLIGIPTDFITAMKVYELSYLY